MKFALESEMVNSIKFNYMNDKTHSKENWACNYCAKVKQKYSPDSIKHMIICDEYEDLRKNTNLDNDINHVDYFIKIVKVRNELTHEVDP